MHIQNKNEMRNKNYMHILKLMLWTHIKCSSLKLQDIKYNSGISDVQMDASTEEHVDCTWTWWSSDGCSREELWIHVNTPVSSDGCSAEGLADAHEHPESPFRWLPRQRDLLRNLNDAFGQLWMLLQRDL